MNDLRLSSDPGAKISVCALCLLKKLKLIRPDPNHGTCVGEVNVNDNMCKSVCVCVQRCLQYIKSCVPQEPNSQVRSGSLLLLHSYRLCRFSIVHVLFVFNKVIAITFE